MSSMIKQSGVVLAAAATMGVGDLSAMPQADNTPVATQATAQSNDSQLFAGQMTHPLTEQEKKEFLRKIHVSGRWFSFGDESAITETLKNDLDNNPAVRQFARYVNQNHPTISFNIETSRTNDKLLRSLGWQALYNSKSHSIAVDSNIVTNSPSDISGFLCHEMLHQIQDTHHDFNTANRILVDTETQALTHAINCYNNSALSDPAFQISLEKNKQTWEKIAAGKLKKPSWAPEFKCLVPGKEAEAREAYIQEQALLETKAQWMQDFMNTKHWGKGGTRLPVPSYLNYSTQQNYSMQPTVGKADPTHLIQSMITRNPGLGRSDFKNLIPSTNSALNAQDYQQQIFVLKEDILQEMGKMAQNPEQYNEWKKKLPTKVQRSIESKPKLTQGLALTIPYVMEHKELEPGMKKTILGDIISTLKRLDSAPDSKPTPERTYAIEQLKKLTGHKMPIVKADVQQPESAQPGTGTEFTQGKPSTLMATIKKASQKNDTFAYAMAKKNGGHVA